MDFFFSGELDVLVSEYWMRVGNRVERKLNAFAQGRDYGSAIKHIGIIPIILRPELQANQRERRLFQRKQLSADYRTWIDFEKFKAGPDDIREKLLLKNTIEVISDLTRKAGNAFAGQQLIEDVLTLFDVTQQELDAV